MPRLPRPLRTLAPVAGLTALAVAVPALASDALTAHDSAAVRCTRNGVHVRCPLRLVRGPRGPRGFTGARGPQGPAGKTGAKGSSGPGGPRGRTGATGATGATGPAGTPGTARAYALVDPTPASGPILVSAQTSNVTGVRRAAPGTYCLTAGTGIDPNKAAASVTADLGHSTAGIVPTAVLNSLHPNCTATEFEVRTYDATKLNLGPVENGAAFTIVIP